MAQVWLRLAGNCKDADRIPVDQIGNIDPNREAQWGQYEDGPIDQGQ
jgi:hypothetical protein